MLGKLSFPKSMQTHEWACGPGQSIKPTKESHFVKGP